MLQLISGPRDGEQVSDGAAASQLAFQLGFVCTVQLSQHCVCGKGAAPHWDAAAHPVAVWLLASKAASEPGDALDGVDMTLLHR